MQITELTFTRLTIVTKSLTIISIIWRSHWLKPYRSVSQDGSWHLFIGPLRIYYIK